MQARDNYKQALAVVASVIRQWDPYSLLEGGASADEFDAEIAKVAARVPYMRSGQEAAQVLSEVFSEAFEPHLFTPEACEAPGSSLFTRLAENGLASHA